MAEVPENPRKTPRQARSRATCEAVVEAAARILETEGAEAFNTNSIARRAGVSIGTLYQYYPDKQSILAELIRRERALLLADFHAIPEHSATPLADMVAASIRHQFARPALALALERLERGLDLDAETMVLTREIAAIAERLLEGAFGKLDLTSRLDAIAIARALINGAAEGGLPVEGLAERVLLAVGAYLSAAP